LAGDQVRFFRVTSAGKGEVYYETGQAHVTSLALDREGRLLAGSEPNGILYRVTAKDKAFVLYDANLPEIRSIVAAPDGTIYAAALGGSVARAAQAAQKAAQGTGSAAAPRQCHHYRHRGGGAGGRCADAQIRRGQDSPAGWPSPRQHSCSGHDAWKTALYRIIPDNTVETPGA
jgi:hypothetical protein